MTTARHNPQSVRDSKRTFPDWIAFLIFAFSSLLSELDEGIYRPYLLDVTAPSWLAVKHDDAAPRSAFKADRRQLGVRLTLHHNIRQQGTSGDSQDVAQACSLHEKASLTAGLPSIALLQAYTHSSSEGTPDWKSICHHQRRQGCQSASSRQASRQY